MIINKQPHILHRHFIAVADKRVVEAVPVAVGQYYSVIEQYCLRRHYPFSIRMLWNMNAFFGKLGGHGT